MTDNPYRQPPSGRLPSKGVTATILTGFPLHPGSSGLSSLPGCLNLVDAGFAILSGPLSQETFSPAL